MTFKRPNPPTTDQLPEEPRADAVIDRVMAGFVLLDDAVIELADADAISGIARLIAPRVGLAVDKVVRAVDAPSEDALMVICRAAGLNINGYSAILRMRRRICGASSAPAEALAAFHRTPLDTARRVVRMLRVRDVVEFPG